MNILNRLRTAQKAKQEKGLASLIYILLITLIAGYLGFAMDSAVGNYTANGLKNSMDTATLAASGKTMYYGNKQVIVKSTAERTFKSQYAQYRKAYPNVTVKGGFSPKFSYNSNSAPTRITVTVQEKSNTRFLALLGTKEFNYNLKSSARLGALYEMK